MKKILITSACLVSLLLTGCVNKDAKNFKNEYESLNGTKTSYSDNLYRTVSIDKNNSFIYSDAKEIVEKINNKETFYVYFGSSYCPWCRSVIEKAVEVSKGKKIYYVNIWKGFHEEILRDTYELDENNNPKLVKEGTKEYKELLNSFGEILEDYTLTTENGNKVSVGEKRIFAPTFIYVENGKAKKMTTAISKKQTKSDQKLTKSILNDEENDLKELFDK